MAVTAMTATRSEKRIAILLIVMLSLDFIHSQHEYIHQQLHLPRSDTLVKPAKENTFVSNEDRLQHYEASGESIQESSYSTTEPESDSKWIFFLENFVSLLKTANYSLGDRANISCEELSGSRFSEWIKEVPIATDLIQLALLGAELMSGCFTEAAQRLEQFSDADLDADIFSELIYSVVEIRGENYTSSSRNTSHELPKDVSRLTDQLKAAVNQVQIIQAVEAERHERPYGVLKCAWAEFEENVSPNQSCSELLKLSNHSLFQQLHVSSLVAAKLICEKKESPCAGVYHVQHEDDSDEFYTFNDNFTTGWCYDNNASISLYSKTCYAELEEVYDSVSEESVHKRNRRSENENEPLKVVAVLYEGKNFSGNSIVVSDSVNSFISNWDNTVSSIWCNETCTVFAFEQENFEGRQIAFEGPMASIAPEFDNAISSLAIFPFPLSLLCYTVYELEDFNGESEQLCGDQDLTDSVWEGNVWSISVECEECSVIFYDSLFTGRFKAFSGNVTHVDSKWRELVTSIQVRPWRYDQHEGELAPIVTIYLEKDYRGHSKVTSASLDKIDGIMYRSVSSFQCDGQCSIIMFDEKDFNGNSTLYRGSQARLGSFDNKAMSMLIFSESFCVLLFERVEFQGNSVRYCEDVADLGSWNSSVSSLKVECDQCSVVVNSESNFDGVDTAFSGKVVRFERPWDKMIRSLQIRPWKIYTEPVKNYVILYENPQFGGRGKLVIDSIDEIGSALDNKVSSVYCEPSCSFIAFENPNREGNSILFQGQQQQLNYAWNDKISSVIVLPHELCVKIFVQHQWYSQWLRYCQDVSDFGAMWTNRRATILELQCDDCSVFVYEEINFMGREEVFTNKQNNLSRRWWKTIKSFQIRPGKINFENRSPENYIILYADDNFEGQSKVITSAADNVGDALNDKVSSVYCEVSCTFIIFDHVNFEGDSVLIKGSRKILHEFNDKLSSVFVINTELCVTFYEHADYKGESVRFCEDVSNVGWPWHDRFSSLRLECNDCSVIVYEHPNYGGKHKSFITSTRWFENKWNDMISSVQLRPLHVDVDSERGKCVDDEEEKVHNVMQWIPVLGTLYNLGSSIGYGAAGCPSAAKERAIDMAVDVGMSAALALVTVLTAGTASGAVFAVKVGAKFGAKVAVTAISKAAVAVVKNAARNGAKTAAEASAKNLLRAVKSVAVNKVKSVVKLAKSLPREAKSIPRAVKTPLKTSRDVIERASREGFRKTAHVAWSGTKSAAKRKIDDMTERVQKQIDINAKVKFKSKPDIDKTIKVSERRPTGSDVTVGCRRRRMTNPSQCRHGVVRLQEARLRQIESKRIKDAEKFFEGLANLPLVQYGKTRTSVARELIVDSSIAPKDLFGKLKFYDDFMPKSAEGKLERLLVTAKIGGETIRFVLHKATRGNNQILVRTYNKNTGAYVAKRYQDIVESLDIPKDTVARRAKAMLHVLDQTVNQNPINWNSYGNVFNKQQIQSAQELLVLTQVAETAMPSLKNSNLLTTVEEMGWKAATDNTGRVPGVDKFAQAILKEISNNPTGTNVINSFTDAFCDGTNIAKFLMFNKGGTTMMKDVLS